MNDTANSIHLFPNQVMKFIGLFSVPTFINLFAHNNMNCPKWTIIVGSGAQKLHFVLVLRAVAEKVSFD